MATSTAACLFCHFPNCFFTYSFARTINNSNCMFSLTHLSTTLSLPLTPTRTHLHLLASQTNNTTTTRKSRRLKTDDEICSDIRQFLADVGLPQDHIPSTKELLHHGRNDLANIVRRRGHKQIRDLLTSSLYGDIDSLNTGKSLDERLDAANDSEDLLTGQNEKVVTLVDDVVASTEFVHTDSTLRLNEYTSIPVASSASSSLVDGLGELKDHSEQVNNMAKENLYPNMPTEISGESSFETTWSATSEHEDSLMGRMVGDITFPLKVPSMENHSDTSFNDPDLDTADISDINVDTLANLSLEEKVAKFIQNGDLDQVEGVHPPKENSNLAHNGNSLTSNQVVASGKLDQPLWDDHTPHEDPITHFDKDLDNEAPNVPNQSEINHLKFMLKELELSRLKEQIEKEKHALSVLQTKAEEEISKAKKLISEKDAELHGAEESLSGLQEVPVEFFCDGDVVEVAGSFNGWHHPIKMDPQPLTSIIDHGGPRKSRIWSTMLWLYPGVYEIKFVVDGHWRIDPQRESVARGHICNNILRVDR
ncbi:protein PTST homolog 3, chloroplastic isoform X2 [Cicer arietinum]|uniref:Protein PTST homolog 3, chloroplastic isoform X2 n=1 Tax=Cicer arietinum TaxID=3827 RepID=A0A1S2Y240_CICAR|nr:protein PTST homolog 3, chloroplastic isoform X2 [Cicer arietinum]